MNIMYRVLPNSFMANYLTSANKGFYFLLFIKTCNTIRYWWNSSALPIFTRQIL